MNQDRGLVFLFRKLFHYFNCTLFLMLIVFASHALQLRADWPEYRGPTGDGHVAAGSKALGLPLHWSETNNIKWKTPIPYKGWCTPVIMGSQVWLTTAT
ncbi:MAG TPA: hypothetical protein VKM56_02870, partial [Verrucomicrobiae bacterium]|nr:hypothetical protein [Verrucomicrobiae bacterium]